MKELKKGLYYVGILNPNLRVFDIIMTTEFGTSYNSYIVSGKKNALIETAHNRFFPQFLENIKEVCDISEIEYAILNHTEPDHSGSLDRLLDINPNIKIVGTASAIKNLKNIMNRDFEEIQVKAGDKIDLGDGVELEFIPAPNLHWPDSMFTYCKAKNVVFTCDFLGAHYCEPAITDNIIYYPNEYKSAFLNYYNAIFSPFRPFVLQGLEKLRQINFDMVCPSHGPVLQKEIEYAMTSYEEWSQNRTIKGKASIFYVSAYGYTEMLAVALCEELKENGYDCTAYDIIKHTQGELAHALETSEIYLFGSPTINRDAVKPVWDLISCIDPVSNRGKKTIAFGSYGWSGEGARNLIQRLSSIGLKTLQTPIQICFKPTDKDLESCKATALEFIKE